MTAKILTIVAAMTLALPAMALSTKTKAPTRVKEIKGERFRMTPTSKGATLYNINTRTSVEVSLAEKEATARLGNIVKGSGKVRAEKAVDTWGSIRDFKKTYSSYFEKSLELNASKEKQNKAAEEFNQRVNEQLEGLKENESQIDARLAAAIMASGTARLEAFLLDGKKVESLTAEQKSDLDFVLEFLRDMNKEANSSITDGAIVFAGVVNAFLEPIIQKQGPGFTKGSASRAALEKIKTDYREIRKKEGTRTSAVNACARAIGGTYEAGIKKANRFRVDCA